MDANTYVKELGEYVTERLRAVLPDFEVSYRYEFTADPIIGLTSPNLFIRIRRWGRDAWLEDFHDDKNMATRQDCTALQFSGHVDTSQGHSASLVSRENFKRTLFQQVLDAWVTHRLVERGLMPDKDRP